MWLKKKNKIPGRLINLGRKRRRFSIKKILKLFFILTAGAGMVAMVGGVLYFLITAPKMALKTRDVATEDPNIDYRVNAAIRDYLDKTIFTYFKKSNYFLFSEKELLASLVEISPKIFSVEVEKKLPNELKINISLRKKSGIWCVAEKKEKEKEKEKFEYISKQCFNLDSNGFIYEEGEEIVSSLVLLVKDTVSENLKVGMEISRPEILNFIIRLREEFINRTAITIDYFLIEDPSLDDLIVATSDGYYIKVYSTVDTKKTVLNYKNIMEKLADKKIEYIDLRIPDRVYYK